MIANHTQGNLWIGTSNVVLPGKKSSFPAEFQLKSRLNYYSHVFNSVELNSTFYKIPMSSTFEKWSKEVVDEFRFSVKLWKSITHVKELKFIAEDIDLFLGRAEFLQDKKGCLLLQFPGKVSLEYFNKVEEIFTVISNSAYADKCEKVIEFRNDSWHTGETFELLDEYNASMVLHDFSKVKNEELNKNATVIYLRFHGPSGNYKGSYSIEFLQQKAGQIKEWIKSGKDVYVYFNNTAGDGYQNARTLSEITNRQDL